MILWITSIVEIFNYLIGHLLSLVYCFANGSSFMNLSAFSKIMKKYEKVRHPLKDINAYFAS